ncbi:hypothetical protein ACKFKF_29730 [Phormidesmis sp. 146-12]
MVSKFQIGDRVTILLTGESGEVIGIWRREKPNGKEKWVYRMQGLNRFGACWWSEEQIIRGEVRHG